MAGAAGSGKPRPVAIPTMGGAQLWADRRWRAGWRIQQHVLTGHHRLLDPLDRRHRSGSLGACEATLAQQRLPRAPRRVVVVLHGLGRTRRSMKGLADALERAGHHPVRLDYPSTRRGLDAHVAQLLEVLAHLEGAEEVDFVTHSLGGIVTRGALASPRWPARLRPRRLVMLAPPNRGAALARLLTQNVPALFAAVMGPSGHELADGVPFPPPPIPFFVIAASQNGGRGRNPAIEGDDDGVVGVEETKLEGMAGHLAVDALHTFVMDHPEARRAAVGFLSDG